MMHSETDVVVIGAGAAGLAAARKLQDAGASTVVIEARRRIGGRIHTLRLPDWPVPIEAGAEFIHGDTPAVWNLIRAKRLTTDEVPEVHREACDGQIRDVDFEQIWGPISERFQSMDDEDLTFSEFLRRRCADLPERSKQHAIAYVSGFEAADPDLVSVRWLREAERSTGAAAGAHRFRGGYEDLLRALETSDADIRCEHAVRSIHWHAGEVRVHVQTPDGPKTLRAAKTVIALPLAVLQARPSDRSGVAFEPELPQLRLAWARLCVGAVVKTVLRFRQSLKFVVGIEDSGFMHTPEEPFVAWWTPQNNDTILTGWTGGPKALRLSERSDQETIALALDVLSRRLSTPRTQIAEALADARVFDWQRDPFAGGAYSYVPVGAAAIAKTLSEPVADTLYFAGEAFADDQMGTVAGAIASGESAADLILRR